MIRSINIKWRQYNGRFYAISTEYDDVAGYRCIFFYSPDRNSQWLIFDKTGFYDTPTYTGRNQARQIEYIRYRSNIPQDSYVELEGLHNRDPHPRAIERSYMETLATIQTLQATAFGATDVYRHPR